jgi:hypothetical protein
MSKSSVINNLRAAAANSYTHGVKLANSEECIGWEEKVRTGNFKSAEMSAHKAMWHAFGRYGGLIEATRAIECIQGEAEVNRLTAEVERLKAKCGRFRRLISLMNPPSTPRDEKFTAFCAAVDECDAHNDLSPKEPTDGQ